MNNRSSGILLPVFSLPGPYGIGSLGREAYQFVDFLVETGQSYWQILPLGPTGYGDSPYQSFSTYAGNPYLIDLQSLIDQGLLTKAECEEMDFGSVQSSIDYGKLYRYRLPLLRSAFARVKEGDQADFQRFIEQQSDWLQDYALFTAIKRYFHDVGLDQWDEDIRLRRPTALQHYREQLADDVQFYMYLQYWFRRQWLSLKQYANQRGIRIIGDIPIYVSYDSADVWVKPQLFELDEKGLPLRIAGCPPDAFAPQGQRWGNPLYRWERHRADGYRWWINRMACCRELYDVIRIDHFRGFDQYYAIDAREQTAENGLWLKGPGVELFEAIHTALGSIDIIAEDLGFITESVKQLVRVTGYPNMKIIQFGFDARDTGQANDHLPHNYSRNAVMYTGTHDSATLRAWLSEITEEERRQVQAYTQAPSMEEEDLLTGLFRIVFASVADLCVVPLQDYLRLGDEARMNRPSILGGNWLWRVTNKQLDACKNEIYQWTSWGNREKV